MPGYEGLYEVSSHGNVRSLPREVEYVQNGKLVRRIMPGRDLLPNFVGGRYAQVSLYRDGLAEYRKIHRIVCEAFHGLCPPDCTQVRHRDGNDKNNHFDNLRWGTVLENEQDKKLHGSHQRGERHAHAVVSEQQVRTIFSAFWDATEKRTKKAPYGFVKGIACEYGITVSAVENIIYERWWRQVTGEISGRF